MSYATSSDFEVPVLPSFEDDESVRSDDESTSSSVMAVHPPSSKLSLSESVDEPLPRVSLSSALKTGTAVSHEQAEHVHFVKNFIRGNIDRTLYSQLVVNLFHIYQALEDALDDQADKHFGTCHFSTELCRTEALREDLDFWYSSSTSNSCHPPISPATQDYVDRIRYCQKHNPLLLLSHAYTRYLGDLSGGKILARVARRALNLEKDDDGLAFYDFENIGSAKQFKDVYRTALDDLTLTSGEIDSLVHEANIAFGLNMRIFEELDVQGGVPGSHVRPLQHIIHFEKFRRPTRVVSAPSDIPPECPFAKKASKSVGVSAPSRAVKNADEAARCPWPFIMLHDPVEGCKSWQTTMLVALLSLWAYNLFLRN